MSSGANRLSTAAGGGPIQPPGWTPSHPKKGPIDGCAGEDGTPTAFVGLRRVHEVRTPPFRQTCEWDVSVPVPAPADTAQNFNAGQTGPMQTPRHCQSSPATGTHTGGPHARTRARAARHPRPPPPPLTHSLNRPLTPPPPRPLTRLLTHPLTPPPTPTQTRGTCERKWAQGSGRWAAGAGGGHCLGLEEVGELGVVELAVPSDVLRDELQRLRRRGGVCSVDVEACAGSGHVRGLFHPAPHHRPPPSPLPPGREPLLGTGGPQTRR